MMRRKENKNRIDADYLEILSLGSLHKTAEKSTLESLLLDSVLIIAIMIFIIGLLAKAIPMFF